MHRRLVLRDASNTVQVRVASVRKNLGQASVQVKRVVRCDAIRSLAQPITHAVVRIGVGVRALRGTLQPIRLVIGIREQAIIQQITIGVPSVRLSVHSCQAIAL